MHQEPMSIINTIFTIIVLAIMLYEKQNVCQSWFQNFKRKLQELQVSILNVNGYQKLYQIQFFKMRDLYLCITRKYSHIYRELEKKGTI